MECLKILDRKIVTQGQSHFIYLPKAYFDNGQLDIDGRYDINLVPHKENTDPKE